MTAAARFRRAGGLKPNATASFVQNFKKESARVNPHMVAFWQNPPRRGRGRPAAPGRSGKGAPTAGGGPGQRGCGGGGAAGPASIGCTGSRRDTFRRVHRISRGTAEVNAPGKLMDVTESAPRPFYS